MIGVYRAVSQGESKKALIYYETQASRYEVLGKSSESPEGYRRAAAQAYREASNAARHLGDLQKAIDYGARALKLAEGIDNANLKLAAISSLEQAHRSTRDFAKAAEFISYGLELARQFPDNSLNRLWWDGVFFVKRAQEHNRQRRYQKAIEDFQDAITFKQDYLSRVAERVKNIDDRREHAQISLTLAYRALGDAYSSMGNPDRALASYQIGIEAAEKWALELPQTGLYLGVGNILHGRMEYAAALDSFHNALRFAQQQRWPALISIAARRIGDILREMGRGTEAVAFYREAVAQIESMRSLLASEQNRQSYFGGWLGAYQGMIGALWNTGDYGQAFDYSERIRSRTFLDILGSKPRFSGVATSSTEESFSVADAVFFDGRQEVAGGLSQTVARKIRKTDTEQASLLSETPLTLQQVQTLLEPGQALLEYLVTPEKIYLWVVDKQQVRAHEVRLTRKEIVVKVQALRTAISDLRQLEEFQAIARDLHDTLVAPIRPLIRGKEIIIVPHDVLHYMPFQALYSPQGKYLVEDHSISYLSSASLLRFTKAKRRPVGEKVLAFGNPSFDVAKVSLPMSELETDEIGRLFSRATVLVKSEATEEKVKALSQNYDVLHFATHAELSKANPLSSAVFFAKTTNEDGRLEVREIFGMDLKASLVVLSGCETGLGELSSGDELVGLTRAFIYAGTPSVVASLWKVDDASTAHLMGSFYRNLKTKTKVESLRQAQLAMIRGKVNTNLLAQRGVGGVGKLGQAPARASLSQNSISTSHPYFWAPFILVGDGK